ncbi:TPA: site-specific integrase [Burkholderia cenocepacia]|nr:site-specific integrase [Burkholderia cenocepacia]
MASIVPIKGKKGVTFQARVRIVGYPTRSKSFGTRKDAVEWARLTESSMYRGEHPADKSAAGMTLREAIEAYRDEVAPTHRGVRTELERIRVLLRQPMCDCTLAGLNTKILNTWKNNRLRTVTGGSVRREMTILRGAIRHARNAHGVLLKECPVSAIQRPKENAARDRRLAEGEQAALLAGCERGRNPLMAAVIEFALETAMRQGEIVGLQWKHVDRTKRIALLPMTKNGKPRAVPLTDRAVEILESIPKEGPRVFSTFTGNSIRHCWTRLVKRCGIFDLHFHDLRHEAISRLVERGDLNVLEIAAISGHTDMSMLKRYTHLRAEDIAKKLNAKA